MKDGERSDKSNVVTGAAVVFAALASACCILPLALGSVGLGVVAVSVAGTLEPFRPYLLILSGALLGAGFYFAYRPARVPDGAACEAPAGGISRLSKPMLWLGTIAVISLALFPSYAAHLEEPVTPASEIANHATSQRVILQVEGMTCEACTSGVAAELLKVPGVVGADVEYIAGVARVSWRRNEPPNIANLIAAVERAGYSANVAKPSP